MTVPLASSPPALLPRMTRSGAALTREVEVLDEYGQRRTIHITATMHPTPPLMIASGAPNSCATTPASTSPSCGPPWKKIWLTLVIRPRK